VITKRVVLVGGVLGWFITERMRLDAALRDLDRAGFRMVFQVHERWNVVQKLGVILIALTTIGLYWPREGYLITAERRGPDPLATRV
jgi:hypothetical protein